MSVRRQLIPGLFLVAVAGSLVALPGTAIAAPAAPNAPVNPAAAYPPPVPTARVSTTTPTVGSSLGIAFAGFRARERVSVDLVPSFRHLGTLRSNPSGNGYGSLRIPSGVRGSQILLVTGLGSGRAATVIINVLGPPVAQPGQAGPGTGTGAGAGAGVPGSGSASGGSSGRAAEGGSAGGMTGSESAGGSAGLASTGFSAYEYGRIAGGLIMAGLALALVGRRVRRRTKAKSG
jgi:hypothetical protein